MYGSTPLTTGCRNADLLTYFNFTAKRTSALAKMAFTVQDTFSLKTRRRSMT